MRRWPYRPGDAWATCDFCGFRFWHSELRKNWQGFMVCSKDFEERHPQDLIKARKEKVSVDNARPEQPDVFIDPGY